MSADADITGGRYGNRYSTVAIILHWVIALLILANLAIGWRMGFLKGLAQFELFQLHKSIGITVLIASVLRLFWRMGHRPPPLPETSRRWEVLASRWVHATFYIIMIALPVTGWAIVSVSPYNLPTMLWHVLPWPHIAPLHELSASSKVDVLKISGGSHKILAFGTAALVALHVAAALKHQFLDGDSLLTRMMPRIRQSK